MAGYIQYLKLAVNEAPRKAGPHLKLGNACEEAHKPAEAIVQWRMVLDIEPDHPQRMALLDRIKKARASAPAPATRKAS